MGRPSPTRPTGRPPTASSPPSSSNTSSKAKPIATGGPPATLTQVMSDQIDVGWSAPPVGLDLLDQGRIRILATGNDTLFRDQTVRLLITNVQTLQSRKAVIDRYMKAYRETVDWMYSDPAALKTYAEFAGISEPIAKRIRDGFFPKDGAVARHRQGPRRHRQGCGGAEIHRVRAGQGAAGGADPDSATVAVAHVVVPRLDRGTGTPCTNCFARLLRPSSAGVTGSRIGASAPPGMTIEGSRRGRLGPLHRLAHLEALELRMLEVERLVVAGAAVGGAELVRPGPRLERRPCSATPCARNRACGPRARAL